MEGCRKISRLKRPAHPYDIFHEISKCAKRITCQQFCDVRSLFSNDLKSWDIELICVDLPASCIISSCVALIVNILVWAGHGTDYLSAYLEEHAADGLGPGQRKTYEQRKPLIPKREGHRFLCPSSFLRVWS